MPIPIPNNVSIVEKYITSLNPKGILLTGGNSLVKYGGDAPEKDEVDKLLITLSIDKNIPLLGFCRGMQSIADYFGCSLHNVENHIAVHHDILLDSGDVVANVNSYHKQALLEVGKPLKKLVVSADGIIEGIRHCRKTIMGIMWHPERENPFKKEDIELFQKFFLERKVKISHGDE